MTLIDDEGRLFGAVNVIDALVVLLVLAVAISGVALVAPPGGGGDGSSDSATRYSTIDLGERPLLVAKTVSPGDMVSFEGTANELTLTDVYVSPTDGNNASVVIRAEVHGELIDRDAGNGTIFAFDGAPFLPGRDLRIRTDKYVLTGVVTKVDATGPQLDTGETSVLVRTTVARNIADNIEPGDAYRIANRTVGTVESVTVYPTADPDVKRLDLGLSLRTFAVGATQQFANRPLLVGMNLSFAAESYRVSGRVVRLGEAAPPGDAGTTTVTVKLKGVPPAVANNVEVGMTESASGTIFARVTDKQVEPAMVVLESEDGDIHAREHPLNKDVYLTVELRTRRTDTGLWFHGRSLQATTSIVLDLGSITVQGKVVEIAG